MMDDENDIDTLRIREHANKSLKDLHGISKELMQIIEKTYIDGYVQGQEDKRIELSKTIKRYEKTYNTLNIIMAGAYMISLVIIIVFCLYIKNGR